MRYRQNDGVSCIKIDECTDATHIHMSGINSTCKDNIGEYDYSGDEGYETTGIGSVRSVGYVHKDNLVGKAQFIFFSSDFRIGSIFAFWKWHKTIRFDRFFKKIV